jgi:hypothetical protein
MHIAYRLVLAIVIVLAPGVAPWVQGQTYESQIEHPIVQYQMSATLNPANKTIKGHYTLTWWNHTDETIPELYFHLYLNAFKNMDSTFMREASSGQREGVLKDWLSIPGKDKWGWVDIDHIQIVNGADLTPLVSYAHPDDNNTKDQTVVHIQLPRPIPSKGSIDLSVVFTAKLPRALARTGYDGNYFLVGQWFPKIGVYEGPGERGRTSGGWNCHEFHANTEFYADYGTYDVNLTVPSSYVVGATGISRSTQKNPNGTTTYNFCQQDVHDFAWTTSPRFLKVERTFDWGKQVRGDEIVKWGEILGVPSADMALRDVAVTLLLQPDHQGLEDRYFKAIFNALKYYGLMYGKYPYDTLTVVDPPRNSNTSGMEYPTFIVAGAGYWPGKREFNPEFVTVHEFGHQYWYGLVGNNEFEESWLDEGFTTYSTGQTLSAAYGEPCAYLRVWGIPIPAFSWLNVPAPAFPFVNVGSIPLGPYFSCVKQPERTSRRVYYLEHATDDVLVRNGWQYLSGDSYVVNSYPRTGLALETLQGYLGRDTMARVLRTYQQKWRYRHPATRDFIDVVNRVSGKNMDWFFQQFFYSSSIADYAVSSITNEPLLGRVGIYDESGKKNYYPRADTEKAYEKSKDKRYRSIVTVRRLGGAKAPVDVEVKFANGELAHEHWDGKYRWAKFTYEKTDKVESAQVDPGEKLVFDANFTNDSLSLKRDKLFAAKWYVRWIFWIENLFFAAGFFS